MLLKDKEKANQKTDKTPKCLICWIVFFYFTTILFSYSQQAYQTPISFLSSVNTTSAQTTKDSLANTWLKIQIDTNLVDKAILFQNSNIHLTQYQLWVSKNDTLTRVLPNKDQYNNPIKSRYPVYYFIVQSPTAYLNIANQNPKKLQINLQEFGQFGQHASLTVLYLSMYYGLALMCIVFNLVYFLIFRDKRFSSYILLQLAILCLFLYEDGMFFYFTNQNYVLENLHLLLLSTIAVFTCFFTYYFLDYSKLDLPIKRAFAIGCILLMCLCFMSFFYNYLWATYGLVLIDSSFMLWCLYQSIKRFKISVYARFLAINFGLLAIFCIGYYLALYTTPKIKILFNINNLRILSATEIIAISFVLIFKIRTLKEQNSRYKTEIRHYLALLSLNKEIQFQKKQHLFYNQSCVSPTTSLDIDHKVQDQEMIYELTKQYKLTQREAEVLTLIWQGDSNNEIAEKLFLTVHTIKYHVGNLYSKLDISTRRQARELKPNIRN